jgi:hypothetical protein
MPRIPGGDASEPVRRSRPATTPEGREKQLVALAYDLVEKRIREGTATSQEVTHFLKLGSSRELLEQQRLGYENQLLEAKRVSMESQQRMEETYKNAIAAFREYSGQEPMDPVDEYDG